MILTHCHYRLQQFVTTFRIYFDSRTGAPVTRAKNKNIFLTKWCGQKKS